VIPSVRLFVEDIPDALAQILNCLSWVSHSEAK
jgi:hypothetical protein